MISRSHLLGFVVLAVLAASVGTSLQASAGVRNPTKPVVDSLTQFHGNTSDAGRALIVQPDGTRTVGMVAAGDFGLYRPESDGTGDEAFGDDGWVTTDFGRDDGLNAIALTATGGVAAVGWSGGDVAIARYDHSGHPLRSFGNEGLLTKDLGGPDDSAHAVVMQGADRLVAAGGNSTKMVVLRFAPDGSLDPSFGTGGIVTIPSDGPARALTLLTDGALVVAGGTAGGFHLAKLRPDGSFDASFGTSGSERITQGGLAGATALGALPDGRLTVVGERDGDVGLARIDSSGALDPSFGNGGVVVNDLGGDEHPRAVGVKADGSTIVVGEGGPALGFLASYTGDGALNPRFRSKGWVADPDGAWFAITASPQWGWDAVGTYAEYAIFRHWSDAGDTTPVFERMDSAHVMDDTIAVAPQADGRVVALADTSGRIGLVRYRRDGSLDPSFGTAGRVVSELASRPMGIVVQSNGRIVVAGTREKTLVLSAFRPDGSLDRGWGTDAGRTVTTAGDTSPYAIPHAQALQRRDDDRLVLFGTDSRGGLVAQYTPDGHPDPSFGTGGIVTGAFPDHPQVVPKLALPQPGGKTVLVSPSYEVRRINPDGSLDRTFGSNGVVDTGPMFTVSGGLRAAEVLPDGKILLGDTQRDAGGLAIGIARLLPDGAPDPDWTIVRTRVSDSWGPLPQADVKDFFVLADGRFLAVGEMYVARYLPNGLLDVTFGDRGFLTFDRDNTGSAIRNVVHASVDVDGELTVIGSGDWWEPKGGVRFARYLVSRLGAPSVSAWGWNPLGQLGTGNTVDSRVATAVAGLAGLVDVSAGVYHTLALRKDGTVWAWGWNPVGQLGDGTTVDRLSPVQVQGLTDVVEIAAGAYHSLARRRDGTVWAWGWNPVGQLGDGTTVDRHAPVPIRSAGPGVRSIAAGAFHSLSVSDFAFVQAWGWNGVGQLGDGTTVDRHAPVTVPVQWGTQVETVAAGAYHSLLLTTTGVVAGWGWNAYGQLGDGTQVSRMEPTWVPATGWISISGGGLHTLALKEDGTVWAWGSNVVGQLGDGTTADRLSPVRVRSITSATDVSAGLFHNAATTQSGTVLTWGWNGVGQLGDGTTADRRAPAPVPGVPPAAIVATGGFHTFAR